MQQQIGGFGDLDLGRNGERFKGSSRIVIKETIYEDQYQRLFRVTADLGDFSKEYVVRDGGQRAGLVAVRNGAVLLVRQYRLQIDGLSWEIPGGKVEDGETPERAAVRECFEETGFRCQNVRPLLNFHPSLDTLHNPTFLFYSQEVVEEAPRGPDPREVVQQEWVPLDQCIRMVFEQGIVDGFSMLALLAYRQLKVR
jgi:ADP-ribose pyrophosphatase